METKTERNASLLADYQDGMSITQCARKYGIGVTRVNALLVRGGIPRRPRGRYRNDALPCVTPEQEGHNPDPNADCNCTYCH